MINFSLPAIILIPAILSIFEFLIGKYWVKAQGIVSMISSVAVATISFVLLYYFEFNSSYPQFIFDTNIRLSLDGTSCIGLALFSLTFLFISIGSIRSNSGNKIYYFSFMLLQALVSGFLLSQVLITKLILWETSWIPVFIILITSEEKQLSISFSKTWFLSEALIISSFVLNENHLDRSIVFWLLMSGIIIRMLSFDPLIKKTIEKCNFNVSSIVAIILPMLPIFFMIQTAVPFFSNEFNTNYGIIAWIFIASILLWIIRLAIDNKIESVISSQVVIFNSMIGIWLTRPSRTLLAAIFEIIFIKTLINLMIVHYGDRTRNNSRSWLFTIPIIMSFGIPGIIIGRPLLTLISSWYGISPEISIAMLILLVLCFIYSSIMIVPLLVSPPKIKFTLKTITFIMLFAFLIVVALNPDHIQKLLSRSY